MLNTKEEKCLQIKYLLDIWLMKKSYIWYDELTNREVPVV